MPPGGSVVPGEGGKEGAEDGALVGNELGDKDGAAEGDSVGQAVAPEYDILVDMLMSPMYKSSRRAL